ncbi:MAG: LptA/OstA family protein [Chthoniobacterales bacterium]
MKRRSCIVGLLAIFLASLGNGQDVAKAAAGAAKASPSGPKSDSKSDNKSKGLDLNAGITGPITTEIFADEAFFDSNKSIGIFRGRVKVNDPRFNLQADKLTVFISKGSQSGQPSPSPKTEQGAQGALSGQGQGLEKAIAEGNVAVVRDRPDPNGGPPSHAVGRSETAVYVAATGEVELKGMPRVQQGLNTHIGTSPETVMVINQSGQLTTRGPSRTDIRQEPKEDDKKNGKAGKDEKASKDEKPAKPGNKPQPSP